MNGFVSLSCNLHNGSFRTDCDVPFLWDLQEASPEERKKAVPRTVMLGGKAFATYTQAKRIVKLVTDVGAVVNNDPEIGDLLKVGELCCHDA